MQKINMKNKEIVSSAIFDPMLFMYLVTYMYLFINY